MKTEKSEIISQPNDINKQRSEFGDAENHFGGSTETNKKSRNDFERHLNSGLNDKNELTNDIKVQEYINQHKNDEMVQQEKIEQLEEYIQHDNQFGNNNKEELKEVKNNELIIDEIVQANNEKQQFGYVSPHREEKIPTYSPETLIKTEHNQNDEDDNNNEIKNNLMEVKEFCKANNNNPVKVSVTKENLFEDDAAKVNPFTDVSSNEKCNSSLITNKSDPFKTSPPQHSKNIHPTVKPISIVNKPKPPEDYKKSTNTNNPFESLYTQDNLIGDTFVNKQQQNTNPLTNQNSAVGTNNSNNKASIFDDIDIFANNISKLYNFTYNLVTETKTPKVIPQIHNKVPKVTPSFHKKPEIEKKPIVVNFEINNRM